jgi:uncharacterized membrane protein
MKEIRAPAILLVLLCLGFLLYVSQTSSALPERMATHFEIDGQPNGWMSRSDYVAFISMFGVGLPLFVVAVVVLCRFLPDWTVNIPHREYWLSPERRSQTYDFLLARSLWLACPVVGFVGGMHYLTVLANRSVPVHLPGNLLFMMLALFLAILGIWAVGLVRHFRILV